VVELTATDVEEHADRHRAFLAVVQSRVLRLRLDAAKRRSMWLVVRTRYKLKHWGRPRRRRDARRGQLVKMATS